ncbi:MAG: hypothetical protein RMN51_09930 [Verrucomicrobiota bacterium]|nr:hypothetical protein [Limisphaera sp.]MDW8382408.1 hypothetical protein [Verrucomicrobiota bacterium]
MQSRSAVSGLPRWSTGPRVPEPVRSFWLKLAGSLVGQVPTPFFLFSIVPVAAASARLDQSLAGLRVRHWWSAKTQPLPPLWRWWRDRGRGIEVVSEFELRAALAEGYGSDRILVNGPAKHHWLGPFTQGGLTVNFDSVTEIRALAPLARARRWRVGLRLQLPEEHDPEDPACPTQFGLTHSEAALALRHLRQLGLEPEILHFHLRTQVPSAQVYARALKQAAELCKGLRWYPRVIDCGGGWPAEHVQDRHGRQMIKDFSPLAMSQVLRRAQTWFNGFEEYWLEVGRHICAPGGALVVGVRDSKERRGIRHLICDGGRTLHALVSLWENHGMLVWPNRKGQTVLTIVTGPTCMAFDQLARRHLPRSIRAGDCLLWLDAGAYHLSWETRFSHGLAAVYWHDGNEVHLLRPAESFEAWWGRWQNRGAARAE